MRVSLLFTAAFAALLSSQQAAAQTCTINPAQICAATPPTVPTAWYVADFATDPRTNPAVGSGALYGWRQTALSDPCSQYHTGLLDLPGSTVDSYNPAAPWVNLTTTSGVNSIGTALPGIIGGRGSGSFESGTAGWSFEVTVRANVEGDRTNWAKIVNLGTNSQQNSNRCNGEWLVGWQSNSDEISMSTCSNGDENKIDNFVRDAEDLAWYHITSVMQMSPNGRTNYMIYANGVLMSTRAESNPLVEIFRDRATLGRSSWQDAYFNGTIDHFAIYDTALTGPVVKSLYGARMAGCQVNVAPYTNGTLPTGAVIPTFDAQFTSDITRAPNGPADFSWMDVDPQDTACGINSHRGLLTLAGDADWRPSVSAGQFVNLSATSGENFIGQTLNTPFGGVTTGQGSNTEGSAGFSVEVSFKSAFQNAYSKFFALGNADAVPCMPGDMWGGWRASDYGLEVMYCDQDRNTRSIVSRDVPLLVRTWHHLVVSVAQEVANPALATWRVFLDGRVVAVVSGQYMPQAIARKSNLLGRSLYLGTTDTYYAGAIDKFTIYPRALSATQAAALAATATVGGCTQQPNTMAQLPESATVMYATWATDPRPAGAQYGWLQVDTNDTQADQAIHTGMLTLGANGTFNTNQWVNLTATSGPNSANGVNIGWIGGEGTGDYLQGRKGWTFEVVFKVLPTPNTNYSRETLEIFPLAADGSGDGNGMGWAKVFDFGDGNKGDNRDQCENDIVFGFNWRNPWMRFEVCNPVNFGSQVGDTARRPMKVNTWYHAVFTQRLTPEGPIGSMYINGELVESTLMRNYPLYASRQDARLGMSSWPNDPKFNGMIELMAIYSESVNQDAVNVLFAKAFNRDVPNGNGVGSISMSLMSVVLVVVAAALSM